jgi:hypothetical protein
MSTKKPKAKRIHVEIPQPEITASNEPLEVWWPKYVARINESVAAADQYLKVPPGTVFLIPNGPDFIATVKHMRSSSRY